jgi:type IV pilus assembly protein PilV
MRKAKNQAGVMLIEALIGILIFSIGILALLGMQSSAIRNTTDARYRSEASYLASQIVGQMWVDIKQLPSYDTANLAAYPARDAWVTRVATMMPGVAAGGALSPTIQVGPTPGEVRVLVQWQQPGEVQTRQMLILNRIHEGDGV